MNELDLPGLAPHRLELKNGVPVMLLQNLDPPALTNGTRLVVKKMHNNLIECIILTGPKSGRSVLIPRIPLCPSDSPIEFKRLQYSLHVSFAMTVNKSQGQSLKVAGLNLDPPAFSH